MLHFSTIFLLNVATCFVETISTIRWFHIDPKDDPVLTLLSLNRGSVNLRSRGSLELKVDWLVKPSREYARSREMIRFPCETARAAWW